MVKLLDEFPNVHQTFNLVPSLITQIQDYVAEQLTILFLRSQQSLHVIFRRMNDDLRCSICFRPTQFT